MVIYGVVVEGKYDEAALTELIKKCFPDEVMIIPRPCGGRGPLMRSFPGFLEEFRYVHQGNPVDKALVIRDADNKDANQLCEEMRKEIMDRTYPFEVKFVIIIQELETWLLADEQAISRVAQSRSGGIVSRINEALESIVHPKEKLKNVLSEASVTYTDQVAKEIARGSDLSKIENRCPKFSKFQEAVIDC